MQDREQRHHFIGNFCLHNQLIATYYIYKARDIEKAKSCYYEAALAQAYCIEKLNHDPFRTLGRVLYCVLSDNQDLINRYTAYQATPEYERVKDIFYYLGMSVQSVLKDDPETLFASIEGIKKRGSGRIAKVFAGAVPFFEGMLHGNQEMIKEGIATIQQKLQRHQFACTAEYMNLEATGLLKLAWLKGFEIPSTSVFIPQAMLPISEPDNYESYDFFADAEMVPPGFST